MISSHNIKSTTKVILKECFYKYFSTAQKETKHIVLDRFFPDERRTTSTMTGLQTSLGTFWEKLAVKFAEENNFTVINNFELSRPKVIPAELSSLIAEVKKEREDTGGELQYLKEELNELYETNLIPDVEYERMTKGKGADVIISRDNEVYIFDIKTVQVNANSGNSFNETLILWTAYYKYKFGIDAQNINAMLVFPYNSANEMDDTSWWSEFGSRVSPLNHNDVFVGNEFWSFLTGNSNSLNDIITGIDELTEESSFIELYQQAFDCENVDDLKKFSEDVRLAQVTSKFGVELLNDESPWNLRKKFQWRHNETCLFNERFNKLLKADVYVCPTCNQDI